MKNAEAFSSNDKILTPLKTLQELIRFVIPKGNKEMPTRIILALIFLSLATLVSVYTPFLYGKAVDLVAEGKLVDLNDTIKGFDAICKGEYDHLPEAAFYMVGGIEEVIEKAEKLSKDSK